MDINLVEYIELKDPIDIELDQAVDEFLKKLDNIGEDHPAWLTHKRKIRDVRKIILTKLDLREENR